METLHLSLSELKNREKWEAAGFKLPNYDIEEMRKRTLAEPIWMHIGAGNIFRIFPCRLHDELLDQGEVDRGVIILQTYDSERKDAILRPYDLLSTAVTLKSDGNIDLRVVGSIAESIKCEPQFPEDYKLANELFAAPSLQIVSMTITEKGYNLRDLDGEFTDKVKKEFADPDGPQSNAMGALARLLYTRFQNGAHPIALLSMDNCSHNGARLRAAVLAYVEAWCKSGKLPEAFLEYASDESNVSFPWSMIDKITPAADPKVGQMLLDRGYQDVEIRTYEGRKLQPSFVNAEETEYLVIEDNFPNGRPAWEKGGVYFTDRETVDKVETMKVTTCLNPLHTALAIYGCLLGYDRISQEMKDEDLLHLIKQIGYQEGMPVVVHPGIMDPRDFLDTCINERFPNPFIPDMPQRIANDTSQKLPVRFGKTLQAYCEKLPEQITSLTYIPAVFAGWIRYLIGIDDNGEVFTPSPDPMLATLQEELADLEFGKTDNVADVVTPLLRRDNIFGVDLVEVGLADKVIEGVKQMISGKGNVRKYLQSLD
ncbi:MAG: mannitol dehydrogenase family protein [Clostridiaceae bacterium]|nr:mannitol dehydrogenase family protein [Clostridiaceae bacterium]